METPSAPKGRTRTVIRCFGLLCAIATLWTTPGLAAKADTKQLDLPAGPADKTLREFSVQSGVPVVFGTETAAQVQTNALQGRFTTAEAMDRLLAHTGLVATLNPKTGAFTVARDPNAPRATTPPSVAPSANNDLPRASAAKVPAADVVELSPFTVNAAEDTGWRAQNTLAGSRMNSSLKDTPGVLDVLTQEFLEDVGAISLDQALAYSANFEDNSAGDAGVNSSYPGANQGMNFTIRGQGGTLARNFLGTDFRPEFYTVERIENTSGPNSILFGLGSAGGVANVSTKRAKLMGNSATFEFRIDTHASRRATLDANRVMLPKKLALRVNAIDSRGQGFRKYSDNHLVGVQTALKLRPFENTEINVEYERDRTTGLVVDPRTTYERVTTWIAAGAPTITVPTNWDTLATAARNTLLTSYAPLGIANVGTTDQPVYVGGDQPYLINNKNALRSTGTDRLAPDDRLIPYPVNTSGPGGRKQINRHVLTLSLDQKLARNLYANLSLSQEGGDAQTYQSFRGSGTGSTSLTADPNATLNNAGAILDLSGRTFQQNSAGQILNPHAGEWYLDGRWRQRSQTNTRKVGQVSLAWEFDAGKWFGAHKLVSSGSYSEHGFTADTEDEVWVNAPFNRNPTATANSIYRRAYVTRDDASGFTNVPWMDTPNLTWQHPTLGQLHSGWANSGSSARDDRDSSALVAAQSYFFNRRLVTTVGFRRDEQVDYQYLTHVVKPPGYENSNGFNLVDAASPVSQTTTTGNTRNLGAVIHVNRWLSLYGNQSNAISPIAGWKFGPDGLRGPNQQAEGFDTGLKFNLFEGRIFLDVGYYKTATVGAASHYNMSVKSNGTIGWAWDGIFETLNRPDGATQILNTGDATAVNAVLARYPAIRTVWQSDADLGDTASTGYEARLMANPFNGLRLRATFSVTDISKENQMVFTQEAFGQLKSYLADLKSQYPGAKVGGLTNLSGRTLLSIDENVAAIDQYIQEGIASNTSGYNSSKYRANFNGTYDLTGRFKGWSTGLGLRYNSGRVVANYQIVDPAKPNLILDTLPVFGPGNIVWTGMLRHATRSQFFGRRNRLSFQLNIDNLMNKTGTEIRRYETYQVAPGAPIPPLGPPTIIFVRDPISYSISAKVDF